MLKNRGSLVLDNKISRCVIMFSACAEIWSYLYMTKRMLIDDTQPEETRVVVVNGNKIEDVEFESSFRKQIKGNVYLAKVMRIEPSLQAAFVDYGGNRHGFLAFGEIHPDYYHVSDEVLAEYEKEVDAIIENKKQLILNLSPKKLADQMLNQVHSIYSPYYLISSKLYNLCNTISLMSQ